MRAAKCRRFNRKRIEILTKRLEKISEDSREPDGDRAQCAATEDVLQLIAHHR